MLTHHLESPKDMSKTCKAILLPQHPLPSHRIADLDLAPLKECFSDWRTAQPGEAVGIKITVAHRENTLCAVGPGAFLISQGPEQELDALAARDALRQPHLLKAMEVLLYTNSLLQDVEDIRWQSYRWRPSSEQEGYHMRELWVFPRAALLMDNIHECFADYPKDLPKMALVMHEAPKSNHDALFLSSYINDLLKIASVAALPDLVSEWPADIPEGSIPFAKVCPSDFQIA
jgi:hypothetical protein